MCIQEDLFSFLKPISTQESLKENKIKELINKRRRQVLVHSIFYYKMNTSLIDDATFDKWAYELAELQNQNPKLSKQCILYDDFKDFDGTTGFDLPLCNIKACSIADRLCKYIEFKNNKEGKEK